MSISDLLKGTYEADVINKMSVVYKNIEEKETEWINKGAPVCKEGCGSCCVNFEPHIMECEALYLASWLLENQTEKANAIAKGTFEPLVDANGLGCILFDPNSKWHCTVYEGRCLICRLFGYSGDRGKEGKERFRPCKFMDKERLLEYGMEHRQYEKEELLSKYDILPPLMQDCTAQAISVNPGAMAGTQSLREALPKALNKLIMLLSFMNDKEEFA